MGAVLERMRQLLDRLFQDEPVVRLTNAELSKRVGAGHRATLYAIRDLERTQEIAVEYRKNCRWIGPAKRKVARFEAVENLETWKPLRRLWVC